MPDPVQAEPSDHSLNPSAGSLLGASEEHLRALLQFAPIGIAIIKKRLFVRVNQALCDLCGYTEQEMIGASTRMIYSSDAEYEKIGRIIYGEQKASESNSLEIRGRQKNGSDIDANLRVAFFDPKHPEDGGICIATDIGGRVRTEKRLREKDRQLATLMGNLPGMAYRCANDAEWTMELVSEGCLALTGYAADEIVGNRVVSYANLIVPEDQAQVWASVQSALEKKVPFQLNYRLLAKDRSIKWVWEQGLGVFNKAGQLEALEGLIIDVTSQKQFESDLRASEENYRSIFEHSISGIFQIDLAGNYQRVNPALARMHGYASPEEMLTQVKDLAVQVYADPAERVRVRKQLFEQGRLENFEIEVLRKGGEHFWILLNAVVVRDAEGRPLYVEGTNIDITEKKRAEGLQKAKSDAEAASRAKSVFLAHMSHEIRTPMNAMLGFCQLMLRDPSLTAKQRDYLNTIDRNGEHLLGIITNILELAKIEAHRLSFTKSRFPIAPMLDELDATFRTRAEMKGLIFELRIESGTPKEFSADRGKVRQILINLIGNALKFTRRGRVTVRVRPPRAEEPANQLYWEVEDTGIGIAATDLERLFEPFEQTDQTRALGGTGLGLPISREYALRMNGELTVESTLNVGSVFRLTLPVVEVAELASPPTPFTAQIAAPVEARSTEIRILVADDVEDNRRLLSQFLLDVGFTVRAVSNGSDAVSECARWKPHCILMDVKMPEVDGIEAIRRIRNADASQVKIIALSAGGSVEERQAALNAGADEFVPKPFRQNELLAKIRRRLAMPPLTEAMSSSASPIKLDNMSSPLSAALKQALIEADLDRILYIIGELGQTNPNLAAEFSNLAERFDYEAILQRLDHSSA